ncbi:unnamed protein product [Phytophthora lilii]|uniref:Unnamed protein product n=1 Tax=Phytophthora lilii TaxID=2077276 RepID=A0A9W6YE37_9STRA|nr:unnamed protein product [Phytophthora lilii]
MEKLDQVALVFITPRKFVQDFKRQHIIPLDEPTLKHDIRRVRGIGPQTASVLECYGVDTLDHLKAELDLFVAGKLEMKDLEDEGAWKTAVTCWETHGQALHYVLHNNRAIEDISQFVCSFTDM